MTGAPAASALLLHQLRSASSAENALVQQFTEAFSVLSIPGRTHVGPLLELCSALENTAEILTEKKLQTFRDAIGVLRDDEALTLVWGMVERERLLEKAQLQPTVFSDAKPSAIERRAEKWSLYFSALKDGEILPEHYCPELRDEKSRPWESSLKDFLDRASAFVYQYRDGHRAHMAGFALEREEKTQLFNQVLLSAVPTLARYFPSQHHALTWALQNSTADWSTAPAASSMHAQANERAA